MGRLKNKGRGAKDSDPKKKWPPSFKIGRFTASKVCLFEAAINNVVLRIPLKTRPSLHSQRKKRRDKQPVNSRTLKDTKGPLKKHKIHKRLNNNLSTKRAELAKLSQPLFSRSNAKNNVKGQLKNGHRQVQSVKSNLKKKGVKEEYKQFDSHDVNLVQCSLVHCHQSSLTVDFQKLAELVCEMKLPSAKWKVTVLMNHDLSTTYQFSNSFPQKSVTFSENSPVCNIKMLGTSVILLGCPKTVDSLRDIEILLEIVNRLDLRDCMVAKI